MLIAEDDESIRTALLDLLRESGYDAVAARDGLELVDLAAASPPHAVVMDLAMPRLDGIEAASTLRSQIGLVHVPIVAITASWLADRADLLAHAGFQGALRKPFTGDRLLAELRRVLNEIEPGHSAAA